MVDSEKRGEKQGEKERVIVSPSLIKFDASTYMYNPWFDLGKGEEWLPKHPVMASLVTNASIGMQQYEDDDDDDTFWCTLSAMIQDSFEENIIPAVLTMETSSETSSETSVPPVK